MQSFPTPLTAEEERYYLDRLRQGDLEAKDILIQRNLRLVAHIVKKYSTSGKETDELIAIGILGLVKAVHTFDASKSSRLATYAARCIENELLMLMRSDRKLGREVSLYDPIGTDKEGNEISLLDIIESDDRDIADQIDLKDNIKRLNTMIKNRLTPREQEIIILRYGLGLRRAITQREIAAKLGISRSYVSRIEKKALEKLREGFA